MIRKFSTLKVLWNFFCLVAHKDPPRLLCSLSTSRSSHDLFWPLQQCFAIFPTIQKALVMLKVALFSCSDFSRMKGYTFFLRSIKGIHKLEWISLKGIFIRITMKQTALLLDKVTQSKMFFKFQLHLSQCRRL